MPAGTGTAIAPVVGIMRIVQYLIQGHDFPPQKNEWNKDSIKEFKDSIEQVTRRRLELRGLDIVEIHLDIEERI